MTVCPLPASNSYLGQLWKHLITRAVVTVIIIILYEYTVCCILYLLSFTLYVVRAVLVT